MVSLQNPILNLLQSQRLHGCGLRIGEKNRINRLHDFTGHLQKIAFVLKRERASRYSSRLKLHNRIEVRCSIQKGLRGPEPLHHIGVGFPPMLRHRPSIVCRTPARNDPAREDTCRAIMFRILSDSLAIYESLFFNRKGFQLPHPAVELGASLANRI